MIFEWRPRGNSQDPRSMRTLRNLDCGCATPYTRRSLIFHRGREMCCIVDGGFTWRVRRVIPSPLKIPVPVKVCGPTQLGRRDGISGVRNAEFRSGGSVKLIRSDRGCFNGLSPVERFQRVCVRFNSPIIAFNQT